MMCEFRAESRRRRWRLSRARRRATASACAAICVAGALLSSAPAASSQPAASRNAPTRAPRRAGAATRPAAGYVLDYRERAPEIHREIRATLDPIPADVAFQPSVVYRTVQEIELTLDIYRPATRAAAPLAAVIYVHGGGWRFGDKRRERASFIELVRRGYVVFSIDYRFSDVATFPACVQDCLAALRWVRANAATLVVDPDRIALMGASAGGHLVSLMAVSGDEFRNGDHPKVAHAIRAVVALYGVYDLRGLKHPSIGGSLAKALIGGDESQRGDAYRAASPIAYVESGFGGPHRPAFLFIHGNVDKIVDVEQSRRMNAALQAAGVTSELIEVVGGGHSFMVGRMNPSPPEFRRRIIEFLDRHTAPLK